MHHPTLTPVRTAKLVADLHALRLRVLAKPGGEHSHLAVLTLQIGLENALCDLVHDLGGADALGAVQQALSADFDAEAIAAYRAQAAFVDCATPTKEQTRAHYELQGALATFHKQQHPASYVHATWRGTLPPDASGALAFALDTPEGFLRLRINAGCAAHLRQTLDPAYWQSAAGSQSCASALSPNAPKSVPSEGVNT